MNEFLMTAGRALAMLALHGGLLIALAWLLERIGLPHSLAAREWWWRCALFGAAVSVSLQLAVVEPLTGHWSPPAVTGSAMRDHWQRAVVATDAKTSSSPATRGNVAAPGNARATASTSRVISPATKTASLERIANSLPPWPMLLLALWLAGTLLRVAGLLRGLVQLRGLPRGATPLASRTMRDEAAEVAAALGIATPPIAVVDALASPLALPAGGVLLPEWTLQLPPSQRRALLAHEFAHLQRRDPQWRIAFALWRAIACGLPLLGLALRRLDHLAELQCDDASARLTGEPLALAECLAQVVARRRPPLPVPAFAAAMATPHSPVLQRAERLLEGVPMSLSPLSWKLRAAPLLAVVTAVLAVPSLLPVAIAPAEASILDGVSMSLHIDDDDNSLRVKLRREGRTLDYRSSGKVAFNDSESDIASLAPGASASLEESVGGVTRRIDFSVANGVINRSYQRDGKPAAFDAEARQWLSATIPSLLREAAIDVPARVARLHKAGGAKAVLDEIGLMQSGHARGRYLAALLPIAPLQGDDLTRAIGLAGAIDSDHDRAEALTALLKQRPLDPAQQLALLEQAGRIGSDHDLGKLLMAVTPTLDDSPALQDAWFKAVGRIGSDYEHQQVLVALLQKPDAGNHRVTRVLEEMNSIGSDHSRGEILAAVAAGTTNADAIAPAYANAIRAMGSDHSQGEAARALIAAKGFGPVSVRELVAVAEAIGSDHSCTELLVELAAVMPVDAGTIGAFRKAASRLPDHNRGEVERALDRRIL